MTHPLTTHTDRADKATIGKDGTVGLDVHLKPRRQRNQPSRQLHKSRSATGIVRRMAWIRSRVGQLAAVLWRVQLSRIVRTQCAKVRAPLLTELLRKMRYKALLGFRPQEITPASFNAFPNLGAFGHTHIVCLTIINGGVR